ncbi:Fur family transcriptional regulator [Paenibacillus durus]|uniref:Fur family transcriptional regulator n=1 Tax=Paenibacillus durus TaxID=44251 RepID=A0A089HT05_PAEDU|nr:Fur family transcriptional regulator [Paenibacillus durus]AIQ13865.1 Fur family transcriptional regulator [Paenibacillus durus]
MEDKWENMIKAMEAKGIRMTAQRKMIAKVFSFSAGFVLPRQIHSFISESFPGASYDTVYRNLRLLVDIGLIEQFNFNEGVRFKLKVNPDQHLHYFICTSCHRTYPLEFCPIENGIKPPESFKVMGHKFEVYGICGDCAD